MKFRSSDYVFISIQKLANDEIGLVYAAERLLILVILSMGLVAGLAYLRDGVTQEYGDSAVALDHLDQGYSFTVKTAGGGTSTSSFSDTSSRNDPVNAAPAGLMLSTTPMNE
jgi:Flp pilus assembly pilin Flp